MGGVIFGWLSVRMLSPDWLSRKLEICHFGQVLKWSRRAWGSGVRAVPRLCIVDPGIHLRTEEKSRKNLNHIIRKTLGWSALNWIRLVDLAIAYDSLDWPAGPCRTCVSRQASGPTPCQCKYLSSCRTRGFPTSTNFYSKLAVWVVMW